MSSFVIKHLFNAHGHCPLLLTLSNCYPANIYVFKVNNRNLFLVFLLLTLNKWMLAGYLSTTETYSEPSQASKVILFAKIFDGLNHWLIFAKSSILDILQGSKYVSTQRKGNSSRKVIMKNLVLCSRIQQLSKISFIYSFATKT